LVGAAGPNSGASLRYQMNLAGLAWLKQQLTAGYDFKSTNNNLLFGGASIFAAKVCVQMAVRIGAPQPLHACDNHELWEKIEPKIRARRRAQFVRVRMDVPEVDADELDDGDFEDVDGYLHDAMQKDD
jgi:hypothetical protein